MLTQILSLGSSLRFLQYFQKITKVWKKQIWKKLQNWKNSSVRYNKMYCLLSYLFQVLHQWTVEDER